MKKTALLIGLALLPLSFAQGEDAPSGPRAGAGMRAKVLEKFDADGDGKLSDEERAAAKAAREAKGNASPRQNGAGAGAKQGGPKGKNGAGQMGAKRGAQMRERILQKFDADGDGKLNEEERAAAKAAREQHIKEFDSNGDGKLDDTERKAAMQARKGQQ